MKIGDKVTVLGDAVYHLWSASNISGKEGEVVSINKDEINIKFPEGTIQSMMKCSPVLLVNSRFLIESELYPHYKSAIAKLTDDEKKALRV